MDLTLTTLVSIPAILAVVNLAKDLGVPAKIAPLVAVVVGIAFAVAQGHFGDTLLYRNVSEGLLLAFAASGLYDVTKPKVREVGEVGVDEEQDYQSRRLATDSTAETIGFRAPSA